jgi:3-oxoacyl-[acyl-carrier protein] reductase|tara:strand:+ start:4214 stop:4873 length:660 start_codon:yes stop_codon:yes gene_type:complete
MRDVLILGASGGIGKAIASEFELMGHKVIKPTSADVDLKSPPDLEENKKVQILINCAGINPVKPFEDITEKDFNDVLKVNFMGFFNIIKQVSPYMRATGGGYILNISSLYGSLSRKNRLMYTTSKHAANGMIKTLALELAKDNIKVNSLSPGFVMTKMTTKNNSKEKIKSWEQKIPLGKLATPQDIANVALFLCSDQNSYITGQDIIVDGGYSIGGFEG